MSRYALMGAATNDLLTYQGKVIVHGNRREMEYLFPNTRIIRITSGRLGRPVIELRDHPDMQSTRFPLRREDFNYA